MSPMEVKGLWYIAKAYNLAANNVDAQKAISAYGQSKYKKYHGSADGWDTGSTDQPAAR